MAAKRFKEPVPFVTQRCIKSCLRNLRLLHPYQERLQEVSDLAFSDQSVYRLQGSWSIFFQERTGAVPQKIIMEIGCSTGSFLTSIAKDYPQFAFIGIDWKHKLTYKAASRAKDVDLKNIIFYRGRAEEIHKLFSAGELDEVWILFPDPWAKRAQLKHRLLQEDFFTALAKVMKPGAKVYIKTDHPGYFQWILAIFGKELPVEASLDVSAYDQPDPPGRGYTIRQIKARRLMSKCELPKKSGRVTACFSLVKHSSDFWNQPHDSSVLFNNRVTTFEKNFIKQGMKIFFIELASLNQSR
jgi:tRNA (guanine-N7-)-methyltransferase